MLWVTVWVSPRGRMDHCPAEAGLRPLIHCSWNCAGHVCLFSGFPSTPRTTKVTPDTPDIQDGNLRRARGIPTSLQGFLRPHGQVSWIQGHLQQGAILHPLDSSFPQPLAGCGPQAGHYQKVFFFFFGIISKSLLFRLTKYFASQHFGSAY